MKSVSTSSDTSKNSEERWFYASINPLLFFFECSFSVVELHVYMMRDADGFFYIADNVQDTCTDVLEHGGVHGDAAVWGEPAICRTGNLNMGLGRCHILHLVCRTCHG